MKIPYGIAHFARIRKEGYFYVDKTPFLPLLESAERGYSSLMLLRPRRMGKSAFVSLLAHYYDVGTAAEHDELFRGLWIHDHPTPEKHSYFVLSLNFSQLTPSSDEAVLAKNFCDAVKASVQMLILRHRGRWPELTALETSLAGYTDAAGLLANLLAMAAGSGKQLYVLIDEYDQFANALLSAGAESTYAKVIQATGFVRAFYRALKAGTETGAVGRLFVTGVSPLLLDDLTSGFNIVKQISLRSQFNAVAGFTHADVERALDELLAARPDLAGQPGLGDRAALLGVLEEHYDGYRFSEDATERVFNSDMVLYFLSELADQGRFPRQMLDMNARTDYRNVQRLAKVAGSRGVERRNVVEQLLDAGFIESALVEQFGVESLSATSQFVSLLYCLGLVTMAQAPSVAGLHRLVIPNRVIRELSWEHLALMLRDQEDIDIDTGDLTHALLGMARRGDIAPFVEIFQSRAIGRMGVKDFRRFDERSLKLMMLAFLSLSRVFHVLSEAELAQGYCDLFLGPSGQVPDARFAWVLELKYLPATARPKEIEAAFTQAAAQLGRYMSDSGLLSIVAQGKELRAGTLVFVSGREVLFRPWEPGGEPGGARGKAPRPKRGARRRGTPGKRR